MPSLETSGIIKIASMSLSVSRSIQKLLMLLGSNPIESEKS